MNDTPASEPLPYRYRYALGYALLTIFAIGLLVLNLQTLPPGMSAGEQASAVASARLTFHVRLDSLNNFAGDIVNFLRATNTVNLPYHLLQKLSLEIFGLSPLGVRLPTVVLAAASIGMMFALLKRWMRANTALVACLLIGSSSWFVATGRLGTPDVMVIFWTMLTLFLATLVSQESRHFALWKALSLITIALSLYTPYTVYLFAAAALATTTQPHLRYVVNYVSKASVGIGSILFALILLPLGFNIWYHLDVLWQLLAIPTALPGVIEFSQSISTALSVLVNPLHVAYDVLPRPLLGIPMAFFAVIGIARLVSDWHSVRSHVVLIWLALLLPLIGLDVNHNLVPLFVPMMLLSAIGVQSLIGYWYRLFPRNPYARIFGLLPIGLLIFAIVQFNYSRYFTGLPYANTTAKLYNQDPFILTEALASKAYHGERLVLIAPQDSTDLYGIDLIFNRQLTVITPDQFASINNAMRVVVAENVWDMLTPGQRALLPTGKTELLVNDRKDSGLRFRVYSSL